MCGGGDDGGVRDESREGNCGGVGKLELKLELELELGPSALARRRVVAGGAAESPRTARLRVSRSNSMTGGQSGQRKGSKLKMIEN